MTAGPATNGRAPGREDGEEASSAVEFAILTPVYLILTVALITIGQLVLIRQQVVVAVRYKAWLRGTSNGFGAASDAAVSRTLFPSFDGTQGSFRSSSLPKDLEAHAIDHSDLYLDAAGKDRVKDPAGSPGNSKALDYQSPIAKAVWNDQATVNPGGPHLQRSRIKGEFAYTAPWLQRWFGSPTIRIQRGHTVLFRKEKRDRGPDDPEGRENLERKVYREHASRGSEVSDRHPIEDFEITENGRPVTNAFPISKTDRENNRFFPPTAPDPNNPIEKNATLDPAIREGSGEDPGIWCRDYRIGGNGSSSADVQAERDFFKRMLGY